MSETEYGVREMTLDEAMNPTLDDAIKRLEGMVFTSDFSPQTLRAIAVNKLALVALREKAEREKGCECCVGHEELAYGRDTLKRSAYIYLDKNFLTADLYSESMAVAICYCPMCGRRLEEHREAD